MEKYYARILSVENSGPTSQMRKMVGNVYRVKRKYENGDASIRNFMFAAKDIEFVGEEEYRLKFDINNLMEG